MVAMLMNTEPPDPFASIESFESLFYPAPYRLADSGRIPPPVRIGGLVRWPRAALEQWIKEGCPVPKNRQNWPKTGS